MLPPPPPQPPQCCFGEIANLMMIVTSMGLNKFSVSMTLALYEDHLRVQTNKQPKKKKK